MSAYWIAHVTIHNIDQYKNYMQLAPKAFEKFNAQFIARGGRYESLEGESFEKHVIIKFKDLETAKACYESTEYMLARQQRNGCCDVMISIVEGL